MKRKPGRGPAPISTNRNPRIDPHSGDILRVGIVTRQVLSIEPGTFGHNQPMVVCHEEHDDGFKMEIRPYLAQWQRWAFDAEVIEYGA